MRDGSKQQVIFVIIFVVGLVVGITGSSEARTSLTSSETARALSPGRSYTSTAATDPDAPTNLSVTISGTTASLDWDDVTGATGYAYRYKLSTAETWGDAVGVSSSSASVSGLSAGLTYDFQVNVTTGDGTSDWTSSVQGTLIPDIPTGLASGAVSSTTITFDWDDMPGATSYGYQYRETDGSWETEQTTDTSLAVITSLDTETAYEIQVRATNSAGASQWSSALNVTTASLQDIYLRPTGLAVTPVGTTPAFDSTGSWRFFGCYSVVSCISDADDNTTAIINRVPPYHRPTNPPRTPTPVPLEWEVTVVFEPIEYRLNEISNKVTNTIDGDTYRNSGLPFWSLHDGELSWAATSDLDGQTAISATIATEVTPAYSNYYWGYAPFGVGYTVDITEYTFPITVQWQVTYTLEQSWQHYGGGGGIFQAILGTVRLKVSCRQCSVESSPVPTPVPRPSYEEVAEDLPIHALPPNPPGLGVGITGPETDSIPWPFADLIRDAAEDSGINSVIIFTTLGFGAALVVFILAMAGTQNIFIASIVGGIVLAMITSPTIGIASVGVLLIYGFVCGAVIVVARPSL